jgi:putative ATPase
MITAEGAEGAAAEFHCSSDGPPTIGRVTDLFDEAGRAAAAAAAPLAVRMRPRTLDEVVGQRHLLGRGSPLRRLVEAPQDGAAPIPLILWGPPGTGKTTIAHVVSLATGRRFVAMSALSSGVKEVRAVIEEARRELGFSGAQTVLFIDEVHRFSKTQQDSLLGAVEDRIVTLVAATTENPFFSVVSPLLSRSLLLTLEPLTADDVRTVVERALHDERGFGGRLKLAADALEHLIRLADGDARRALTSLEAAAAAATEQGSAEVDLGTLEEAVQQAAVRYDREGDQHYDVTSAFIKSIRGSDVDAALHYLARMVVAGEDPRFIARRLVILASEDVGLADPTALLVAMAAAGAVQLIGMPEARLNLAQAVVHLALAPKSNAVIRGIDAATEDVRAGRGGPVPAALRDAHYPGARRLDHGTAYDYSHDHPGGVARQQYPPDDLVGRDYYRPGGHGAEAGIGERLAGLRARVRGTDPPVPPDDPSPGDPPPTGER